MSEALIQAPGAIAVAPPMRTKVLIVYPSHYNEKGALIKIRKALLVPRILPYLAALTPPGYDVRLLNEVVEDLDFDMDVDLVALTGMICHMPRAVEIAREFRRRGKTTVYGGVAAYTFQDQLSGVFDSLVPGEAEGIWPRLLADFERGALQPLYENAAAPALDGLPLPRYDLINPKHYLNSRYDKQHPIYSLETSRGCPHNCDFCLVTRFFGKRMRFRPIDEVVAEIKHCGAKYLFLSDDNIAVAPARARELFIALAPLGVKWIGQFETSAARDPELLRLAAAAGCTAAFLGVESLNQDNLRAVNKPQRDHGDIRDVVKAFTAAGISVTASVIFGLDADTPASIADTARELADAGVQIMMPWIITPLPRTRFFDRCVQQSAFLHTNYNLYDAMHPVIRHHGMSPAQLEQAYWKAAAQFYSLPNIFKRVGRLRAGRIKRLGIQLYHRHKFRQRRHPWAGDA